MVSKDCRYRNICSFASPGILKTKRKKDFSDVFATSSLSEATCAVKYLSREPFASSEQN